ncbi:integral membrane protein [Colletotrichum higginsianum]|nr:integral membrane protein [Colletotrichum higginsianum]
MSQTTDPEAVEVMPEIRTEHQAIASSRKVTVRLDGGGHSSPATSIGVSHGGSKNALSIQLNRTIRPPPEHGAFPLFKVRDHAHNMPESMASKGGVFFPMYQREAMWINFSAGVPFAIKIYVGGVNAVSGFPMTENDTTREKRLRMLNSDKQIQDYMVVPEQRWLDGIVSEDGKIRQFVAQPKGSGFSVEFQVTGDEKVGGIQVELIPMKKKLPAGFDVRYENKESKVGLTAESTWGDVKERIRDEFHVPVNEQILDHHGGRATLGHHPIDFSDGTKLGDTYFPSDFSTLGAWTVLAAEQGEARIWGGGPMMMMCAAAAPMGASAAADDGMAYGSVVPQKPVKSAESAKSRSPRQGDGPRGRGLINQTIEADQHPADAWDVEASVMLNLQILDVESFCAVTGQPAPDTPVDVQSYADSGYPFFEIWGEEKSGIAGEFSEVKSVAQIEAERAEAEGKGAKEEEQSVPVRVVQLGHFRSTFRPVDVLRKELEGLTLGR